MENINNIIDVKGDIRTMAITQKQMSVALGLSPARINELVGEGILVRDETSRNGRILLFDSLKNFFLSKRVADDGVNYWQEKALHEKIKRQMAELDYQKRCGQLYEANTVESVLTEMIIDCRNKLCAIPSKISLQCENQKASVIYEILDREIRDVLTELSEGAENCDFNDEDN